MTSQAAAGTYVRDRALCPSQEFSAHAAQDVMSELGNVKVIPGKR